MESLEGRRYSVGSLRLYVRIARHRAPRRSRALVLVHGLGVSSRHMIPAAEALAPHFEVYIPDLPGCGQSADPDHVLDIREVSEVLAQWAEGAGLRQAVFLGHSFGCQIVAHLAGRRPVLPSAAVLVAPTMDPKDRSTPRQLQALARRSYSGTPRMAWNILRDYARCGPAHLATMLHQAIEDHLEDWLASIPVPTLVVRGDRDTLVSASWAQEVVSRLPDARLAVIPGAGHALNYEAPEALRRVTVDFLRRRGLL